jgi:hypothetical protein
MRPYIYPLGVVAALAISSCGQSSFDASESLVGAERLPPVTELLRETIQINRDTDLAGLHHYLSFELRPDNSLSITHTLDGYDGKDVVGNEKFRLPSDVADSARKTLWRIRPENLQGVENLIFPVGCRPPIDSGMEVAVAFLGKAPMQGDIGIFALPYACKDGQAAVARSALSRMMQSLPDSKVAAAFPPLD